MSKPHLLLLKREDVSVIVEAALPVLAEIRRFSEPYYALKEIRAYPAEAWRIVAVDVKSALPDGEQFVSAVRSEPVRRLSYNRTKKLIAVQTDRLEWLPIFCCRLVRDLLRWQLLGSGALFFQGALVQIAHRGVALLGPPRSGKTTMALALGACGGRLVVDNDLCVVGALTRPVRALGWPRSVCIRSDTLPVLSECYPKLTEHINSFVHPNNRIAPRDYLHVLPAELAKIGNHPIVTESHISCLVFPEFAAAATPTPRITRISAEEAEESLTQNWDFLPERKLGQRAIDGINGTCAWSNLCFNPFLFESFPIPSINLPRVAIRSLARAIPAYKLSQNLSQVARSANIVCEEILPTVA